MHALEKTFVLTSLESNATGVRMSGTTSSALKDGRTNIPTRNLLNMTSRNFIRTWRDLSNVSDDEAASASNMGIG
jgi:hypothetical protein